MTVQEFWMIFKFKRMYLNTFIAIDAILITMIYKTFIRDRINTYNVYIKTGSIGMIGAHTIYKW